MMYVLGCSTVFVCLFVLASCSCPNGWTRFDNSCYLFLETQDTWQNSQQHCFNMDGHLARIENDREKDFLEQNLRVRNKFHNVDYYGYWIDGNDLTAEGTWNWAPNQTMTYFDWAPGEPNSYAGLDQDCICLYGFLNFQMDDNTCSSHFASICELPDLIDQGGHAVG